MLTNHAIPEQQTEQPPEYDYAVPEQQSDPVLAERQIALLRQVSDQLYGHLEQRPTLALFSVRKLQRAWRTYKFRQAVELSVQRYSEMVDFRDAEVARKQMMQFKVMLAKEQEFNTHMVILREHYKEPLKQQTMAETKLRRSSFRPEDHTQMFVGTDDVESASSTIISTIQSVLTPQPDVDIIGAIGECVPELYKYRDFCTNKSRSLHTIKKCTKASDTFKRFVQQTSLKLNPPHSLGA